MPEEKNGLAALLEEETMTEEEDDLLLESNPAGFTDVLARFGGGTLKTILLILGLGFILWMVWGGSDFSLFEREEATNTTQKTQKTQKAVIEEQKEKIIPVITKKEEKPTKAEENSKKWWQFWDKNEATSTENHTSEPLNTASSFSGGNSVDLATIFGSTNNAQPDQGELALSAEYHAWASGQNALQGNIKTGSTLRSSISLLRVTERVFDTPINTQVAANTKIERQNKLNQLQQTLLGLNQQMQTKREALNREFVAFSSESADWRTKANQSQAQINAYINQGQGSEIEKLLKQHNEEKNKSYTASSHAEARRVTSEQMRKTQASMAQIAEIINTNQLAIINNIQVVDFNVDPFSSVLTPAQWRALSPN